MKRWIRFGTTLGLIGGTLAGSLLAFSLRVLALTEAQILEKLAPVPVFTITDEKGAPLVRTVPLREGQRSAAGNARDVAVAGVFINREDAEAFYENLRKASPEVAEGLKLIPVSLGDIYQSARKAREEKSNLVYDFVADESQVQQALVLVNRQLRAEGKPPLEKFNGVPLFAARGGQKGGYLTLEQDGETVIPFFFRKEALQPMIDRFKQDKPELANTVKIQVLDLEGVISTFRSTQKKPNPQRDRQLNLIALIPAQDISSRPVYKDDKQATNQLAPNEGIANTSQLAEAKRLNRKAAELHQQERYSEAEILYLEALAIRREQLGDNHPNTAQSISNLASLYYHQGRYSEAESLHKQALTIRREQLGYDHPDTAISLNQLALLYKSQGRYGEAESLYLQALGILEKHLGVQHPTTVIVRHNLQMLRNRRGE